MYIFSFYHDEPMNWSKFVPIRCRVVGHCYNFCEQICCFCLRSNHRSSMKLKVHLNAPYGVFVLYNFALHILFCMYWT